MSQLPIFGAPMYQQELDDSYQVEINTVGDIKHKMFEFDINGNGDFIDLSATALYVKAKITKADNTAYAKDAEVAFVNNALHSMFSDIIVSINDTKVEGGDDLYYMKAYMNTLFSYSESTMEKQLFASGFEKDDSAKMDDFTNKGHIARRAWTNTGASKEFYGKLFVDLFQQPRYLIGNVNMKIQFLKNIADMVVKTNISGEKPKFVIESAKLYLKKVRPHPQIYNEILGNLTRGGIVHYPINRISFSKITVPKDSHAIMKDQLFYGRVPKIIVMCMVDGDAISGAYAKNPFNFKNFNISSLDLKINGNSSPILPLTPKFKDKLCLREYMNLLESMNIMGKDSCLPITYNEYLSGYTFFTWNLTPDYQGQPQNPARRADIRLDLKFSEVTTSGFEVLLYAVFDSMVMISASGEVVTDY
jgi:hypothetical protein